MMRTAMRPWKDLFFAGLLGLVAITLANSGAGETKPVRVALVKMPYVGERNVPDTSRGPDYLEEGGIRQLLEQQGVQVQPTVTVALTADEERAYGSWNHLALASGDMTKLVAEERRKGNLPIGLLANCNGLLGMLSGLQHSGPSAKPLRVGMVFVDAHGDFNTPETTLSGMLGGMPVAIAAGQCLTRMRMKAGLEPAIPTRHIVEVCVRDTDPLEQELLDRSEIQQLTLDDVRTRSANLHKEMKRLSELTDVIYVHERVGIPHAHFDNMPRGDGRLQSRLHAHPRQALPGRDRHRHAAKHPAERRLRCIEIAVRVNEHHAHAQGFRRRPGMLQPAQHSQKSVAIRQQPNRKIAFSPFFGNQLCHIAAR